MERALSSIFDIIAVPFGFVMRFIYSFVGNYGLSIILFSLLAKPITLPLTIKQKRGMAKTQAIQSKVTELQALYANDPERLN